MKLECPSRANSALAGPPEELHSHVRVSLACHCQRMSLMHGIINWQGEDLETTVTSLGMYPAHTHKAGPGPRERLLTSYFFTSAKRSRRKNVAQPSMAYADPV